MCCIAGRRHIDHRIHKTETHKKVFLFLEANKIACMKQNFECDKLYNNHCDIFIVFVVSKKKALVDLINTKPIFAPHWKQQMSVVLYVFVLFVLVWIKSLFNSRENAIKKMWSNCVANKSKSNNKLIVIIISFVCKYEEIDYLGRQVHIY